MSRRWKGRRNRNARYRADNNHVVEFEADKKTFAQYSQDRKEECLAQNRIAMEKARRPQGFIEGMVYVLSGGGARDAKRMEIEAEFERLNIQCRAFDSAVRAILRCEENRTRQFETLCRSLPHMKPEAQALALKILEGLALAKPALPMPDISKLTFEK